VQNNKEEIKIKKPRGNVNSYEVRVKGISRIKASSQGIVTNKKNIGNQYVGEKAHEANTFSDLEKKENGNSIGKYEDLNKASVKESLKEENKELNNTVDFSKNSDRTDDKISEEPKCPSENKTNKFSKILDFFERPKVFRGLIVAIAFLTVFLIVISVFLVKMVFNQDGIPRIVTVVYNFDKTSKTNHSGEYVFKNGNDQIYINLTEIAPQISLTAIGDTENMRFYKSDGSYMSLKKGSNYIEINGVEIILPAKIIIEDNEVFVPVEVLQYYTSGLSVEYNIYRERLTVSFVKSGDPSSSLSSYEEFTFLPSQPKPIEPIPEPEP